MASPGSDPIPDADSVHGMAARGLAEAERLLAGLAANVFASISAPCDVDECTRQERERLAAALERPPRHSGPIDGLVVTDFVRAG